MIITKDVISDLEHLGYIGLFPKGIDVLLVSLPIAISELEYLGYKGITPSVLKSILKEHNVFIFNSPDDWYKFKDPEGYKKKRKRYA